jgi:hypothetical protein
VNNTSAIVQGKSIIDMPMAAWNSISADIWRSRWTRYAQASAQTRKRQVEIRRRSRREIELSYELFQENGAYWPLFLPLTSSHARPRAWT